MSSSKPLYLVIEENSTEDRASLKSSESSCTSSETADASSPSKLYKTNTCCAGYGLASGRLFRLLCKLTGVWNPRKTRYAVLCSVFVLLNVLSLLAEILILSICGPFVDRCVTHPERVTNASRHASQKKSIQEIYEITLVFDVWMAFSDTMTFILLVYTLWRMPLTLPSFSLSSAFAKVKPREWLVINTMSMASSLAITTASAFRIAAVEPSKTKFYGTFGAGVVILYLTTFSCCCVFAVLSCALGSLADTCFMDICNMTGGNLNDVTDAHQKLCKQLSTACHLLKPWFLVHWFMFGANCLVVFAFDFINISVLSENFSGPPTICMAVAFLLNFSMFLVPCVYASRVTWKCDELLFRVNSMNGAEWNEGHPFRQRAAVNEFIFYAERSKCGFRIGTMTFGSSATWISVLLGLLGLGVRLVTYIT